MSKRIIGLLELAALFFTGRSSAGGTSAEAGSAGVTITRWSTSIGGAEGNPGQQVLSYQPACRTTPPAGWVPPNLGEELAAHVTDTDRRIMVGKTLAPHAFMQIDGETRFKSKGATKEEIRRWEPSFTGIRLSTETTLPLPGQTGK
jgi:hypothetical protein